MKYSERKEMAELGKRVRDWLRSLPGPISGHSPVRVYEVAVERFTEATGVDCSYGFMVDSLFAYGIAADQVGATWWLRIPGKDRAYAERNADTPTRIS